MLHFRNVKNFGVAKFHTSSAAALRKRVSPNIKLRRPIVPTINNLKINDDHPLWQFFSNKTFLRAPSEVTSSGRSWTVQELRRKGFDDLHCLWYICLKERNILAREQRLMSSIDSPSSEVYEQQSDVLRETMWRIKHVLSERYHSHNNFINGDKTKLEEYLKDFKQRYLDSEQDVESQDWLDRLERFQYAIFGIPTSFEPDMVIDVNYVKGVRFMGELKFKRFNKDKQDELKDIVEFFSIFEAEPTQKGFDEAYEKIKQYRLTDHKVFTKNFDIELVQAFVENRLQYEVGNGNGNENENENENGKSL